MGSTSTDAISTEPSVTTDQEHATADLKVFWQIRLSYSTGLCTQLIHATKSVENKVRSKINQVNLHFSDSVIDSGHKRNLCPNIQFWPGSANMTRYDTAWIWKYEAFNVRFCFGPVEPNKSCHHQMRAKKLLHGQTLPKAQQTQMSSP